MFILYSKIIKIKLIYKIINDHIKTNSKVNNKFKLKISKANNM